LATWQDFEEIVRLTEGYSGADIKALCTEAAVITSPIL
jgi:SpoVK/Ycf46/Vps4 family AAA+-type ATPase